MHNRTPRQGEQPASATVCAATGMRHSNTDENSKFSCGKPVQGRFSGQNSLNWNIYLMPQNFRESNLAKV